VYHLAAINGTKYFYEIPGKVLNVNVNGTINFVNWLQNSKVKRFFFSSSSEVYGFPKVFPTPETEELSIPDPTNPRFSYSSSKILGEIIVINFARTFGIDYSIGRIHNAYGPQMGFEHVMPEFIKRCVLNEEFTVQGDGAESRCFCFNDITDIAKTSRFSPISLNCKLFIQNTSFYEFRHNMLKSHLWPICIMNSSNTVINSK
jgi:nucleoside-diphosphate-sugar epimerase